MIQLNGMGTITNRFAQLYYEPLRITIKLRQPSQLVNYNPVHLDGLLARAVIDMVTNGRGVQDNEDGYWIPLPLKMLWQSNSGFPLWAASVLYPVGETREDVYIRHKRNSEGWMHNKKKLTTRNGPWMERRIPTPTLLCKKLEGRCIGNLEAVKSLLETFTHIGKLRLARVDSVVIEPHDYIQDDILIDDDNKLLRPIPAASNLTPWPFNPQLIGWTPPHWKPSLFALGWPAGTDMNHIMMQGGKNETV